MSGTVLVTGSRAWTDRDTIRQALFNAEPIGTVIHGGARGADRIADELAAELGYSVEIYPADWDRYGKAAGHRRNAEMVATKPDVVLAFPIGLSPGTRGCIELARRAGIPVRIYEGTPK